MLESNGLRHSLGTALAAVCLTQLGCNSSPSTPKYASPQAVFDAANTFVKSKDYESFFRCLTPESQDYLAGMLVMGPMLFKQMATRMGGGKDAAKAFEPVDKVLQKHGVNPDKIDLAAHSQITEKEDQIKNVVALATGIKDKPAFMADMIKAMEGVAKNSNKNFIESRLPYGDVKLEDVKVDDNSATGTAVNSKNGTKEEVKFTNIDGGWRIALDAGPI